MKSADGTCLLCKKTITKKGIAKHLDSCPKRFQKKAGNPQESTVFRLLVEGTEWPEYWVCLDVPSRVTLKQFDRFLRRLWLECCSHMSSFEINQKTYYSDSESVEELGGEEMNFSLGQLVSKGKRFSYEYDFGSTTNLSLRVLSEQSGSARSRKIELLARNNPPFLKCEFCGWMATQICGVCDREQGITCDRCMKKHECGEDMFLPLVNSPRTGVCGYTGGPQTRPIVQRGWVFTGTPKTVAGKNKPRDENIPKKSGVMK